MNDKENYNVPMTEPLTSYGAITHESFDGSYEPYTPTILDHPKGEPEQPSQLSIEDCSTDQAAEEHHGKNDRGNDDVPKGFGSIAHRTQSLLCGVVLIEVPAFLFHLSYSTITPLTQYYLTARLNEELGSASAAGNGTSGGGESVLSDEVQYKVASYMMVIAFLTYFPAIFPALFMGALSDRFGRKAALYIVPSGMIVRMVLYTLVFQYSWPIGVLYIAGLAEGVTGGVSTFVMATFSVVADLTQKGQPQRACRFTVLEAITMIGMSVGNMTTGYWVTATGYVTPMIFCIALQVNVLLFVIIAIPETFRGSEKTSQPVTCAALFGSVHVFRKRGKRCFFFTCLTAYLIGHFVVTGEMIIIVLYLLSPPFNWNENMVSIYVGLSMISSWLTVLVAMYCMIGRVASDTSALVGGFSGIVGYTLKGLATSNLFMYIAAGVSLLSNLAWPMLKALMSKAVSADEQGSLFGGIAVMQMLATTLSGVISPALLKASLYTIHGLPFFVYAGIYVVIVFCLISLIVRRKAIDAQDIHEEEHVILTDEASSQE